MSANGFCKSVTVKELGCIFPVAKHLTITFISKLTAVSDVGDSVMRSTTNIIPAVVLPLCNFFKFLENIDGI